MKSLLLTFSLLFLTVIATPSSAYSAALRVIGAGAADAGSAARQAAAATGGKVIDVRLSNNNGEAVYLVKVLLDDGRVKVVTISGQRGAAPGR